MSKRYARQLHSADGLIAAVEQYDMCIRDSSFPVQITVGSSDLLDELPQPVLSRCRRIKPDAASLNECATVNRFRADVFHCFNAHHILSTSCFVELFRTKGYGRASCEDTLPHSFHPETI